MIPIAYEWTAEGSMRPLNRFARACDKQFTVGETYTLDVVALRSADSHRHFFACVNECWMNLPDDIAMQFPTAEHLRKWALVKAGFAQERAIACTSRQEARKIAAFIKPMDEYAVVIVREETVKVYTARSQSVKAMGSKEFQASKSAVLDVLANLIGVTPDTLQREAAGQTALAG